MSEAIFSIPDAPEREGSVFKGISQVPNGPLISGPLVVSVGASNVVETDSGDGGSVYTATFYAVWETESVYLPTMWDELAALLSDPLVIMLLVAGFLSVCLFIRNRTGGR